MGVFDLRETAPNSWRASYQGNYGTYTIKIKIGGQKAVDFSCSCPSDYYPCKHIPMVKEAIDDLAVKHAKGNKKHGITLEQLLKGLSPEELRNFIISEAKYNLQLKNSAFLKFAHTVNKKVSKTSAKINNYAQILRNALNSFEADYEDVWHNDYGIDIDVLDQWLDKAEEFSKKDPAEAILICKACIEEFADWHKHQNVEIEYFEGVYTEKPFEILTRIISMPGTDHKELFDYCKSEMAKPKYKMALMYGGFTQLFMELSIKIGSDDFIVWQDESLRKIDDKSSYEAKKILQWKIDFYRKNKQTDKAWDTVKENIQIESFRKELTESLVEKGKLGEAKKLIDEFVSKNEKDGRHLDSWYKLKLRIAQKEKDTPEIRSLSFRFIKNRFDNKYYKIYKSTFPKNEWPEKVEGLIALYEKNTRGQFNPSAADVLKAEKQNERLMEYITKHLSTTNLEEYHKAFASLFPEKTLVLFRRAIDTYAQDSVGDRHYEYVAALFKKMLKIDGGKKVVEEMIEQYRVLYKKRRNMIKVMDRFTTPRKAEVEW